MTDHPPGFFEGTEMPPNWWGALWPDPARVLGDAGLVAGVAAVDVCAGDGWFTLPMARIARHVMAIDIDAKLLSLARFRLRQAGVTNCELKVANAYDLPTTVPAPVDFVFLANAFHGVPEQTRLSRAVASILVPGGHFSIMNWHRRPREETIIGDEPRGPKTELRMTPEAVRAAVEPSGLRFARVAEIPPYHYAAIFAKVSP